jgi:RNA polymerase primary sigma factor
MPVRRAESPFDTYLREIRTWPLLSATEERALGRTIQAGEFESHEARERLIRHNLRLVVSVAKRWTGRGLVLPDLVEEGNLGLVHAAELFDPTRNIRFSTYATWWIQQAIRRSLVNTVKTVRIPRHMAQELTRWRRFARDFEQKEGRPPDVDEVAKAMKATPKRRRLLSRLFTSGASATSAVSLDALFADAQPPSDPRALRPDLLDFDDSDHDRLEHFLNRLESREAQIVRMRYGLDGSERTYTLREIGKALSLSRERVRQLERIAVKRLKSWLGADAR